MKNVFTNLQAGDMYVHKYLKKQVKKKTSLAKYMYIQIINKEQWNNANIFTDKEFKEN